MDKSLFHFIWTHSKREQLILLSVTLLTFPILYLSLELPKRIINDAIGGTGDPVEILGVSFSQTGFLMLLCIGFLLSVLINGLLKMRINTMKGVLAERLLRRFRFQLLTRISRFPRPYFRTTSQGELTSMVTSEAEPMGGLMGDLLSQPVFQAGQMLTILFFLFAQSLWFGLASVALIPLQAWLIPMLQRQINQLNKARIKEVRRLAADIGETAAGVSDIRTNGGTRHRMSMFSSRLGNLFTIRFEIYQKKFFMKFLNNFINQLTPFFFYSVGGYLAIRGDITVGALVAALAAYKDLSSPWKELLAYYNQTQDMALRWEVVTERFAPKTLVDDDLFDGVPDEIPSLKGEIEMTGVTVRDEDGNTILEDISLKIPPGARVAVQTTSEAVAMAFADVLTREVIPNHGHVTVAGQPLNRIHQAVLANRIGYAHSKPHIFEGTLGDNLMMPFRYRPPLADRLPPEVARWQNEAQMTGNSADPFDCDWVDPKLAGFRSPGEIRAWWFELVQAMGADDAMVRRALRSRMNPETQKELTEAVVRLRPEIRKRLKAAGLDEVVYRFHPDRFNPVSPLGSNLLFALPVNMLTQVSLAEEKNFLAILRNEGLIAELSEISAGVIEGLVTTFGTDGTGHPLFRRLNMDEDLYQRLATITAKWRDGGESAVGPEDFALMLTVPFAFSAEQIGPAFSDRFKDKILAIRKARSAEMIASLDGMFMPLRPESYFPVMSLLGNAIYGRISNMAGAREKQIEDIVAEVLSEQGLRALAAQSVYDVETAQGGQNLSAVFRERIAFSRAGIKKPDILILGNALASFDGKLRSTMRDRISELMPEATKIFIEKKIERPEAYDMVIEIVNGRVDGSRIAAPEAEGDADARRDLSRKLKVVSEVDVFSEIDRRQQRLLAFSAQWYKPEPGQIIFDAGDEPDAAYICVKGRAALYWPTESGDHRMVTEILPGRLIGELAILLEKPRPLRFMALEDCVLLRLGASELLAVIEHDAMVAASLLRTVAGHLTSMSDGMRATRAFAVGQGIDFAEFDRTALEPIQD